MILHEVFDGSGWRNLLRDLVVLIFSPAQKFELIIREYQEPRSLRANNYSWALTDKLAEKMLVAGVRLSKDEMHAKMIFDYGQPEMADGVPVFIKALERVNVAEFYDYAEPTGPAEDGYVWWKIYRGSHTYNKQEMNLYLRGIVALCEENGIQTKTPDEIARLISLMKEADDGS